MLAKGKNVTTSGVLTGTYKCKADERSFTYDAEWEEKESRVLWRARISHERHIIDTAADLMPRDRYDVGGAVKRAVEAWIEHFSCSNPAPRRNARGQSVH